MLRVYGQLNIRIAMNVKVRDACEMALCGAKEILAAVGVRCRVLSYLCRATTLGSAR